MSMEVKASRVSQRSTNAGKMSRTVSKASVTPSQMSERTRANLANQQRDPLDSLSRWTQREMAERRSGLQDVDEEYLKNVVYAFAGRTKVAAAQRNEVRADMMPAGVPTARGQQPMIGGQQRMAAGGGGGAAAAAVGGGGVGGGSVADAMNPDAMQNQQNFDAAAAGTGAAAAQEKIMANQQQQQSAAVTKQQIPVNPQQYQLQQQQQQQQSNKPVAPCSPADPEMYTTCPNCRATLYLVRNAGDPSPYGDQPLQQKQQPTAQQQSNQQPTSAQQQQQQPQGASNTAPTGQ